MRKEKWTKKTEKYHRNCIHHATSANSTLKISTLRILYNWINGCPTSYARRVVHRGRNSCRCHQTGSNHLQHFCWHANAPHPKERTIPSDALRQWVSLVRLVCRNDWKRHRNWSLDIQNWHNRHAPLLPLVEWHCSPGGKCVARYFHGNYHMYRLPTHWWQYQRDIHKFSTILACLVCDAWNGISTIENEIKMNWLLTQYATLFFNLI